MKFTLNWLKEYLDISLTAAEIADRLTMLGLEVDSVEELHQGLDNIKVARILAVEPHPDADRLTLCDVDAGEETPVRVVCGAPNARAGLVTAIALPGAILPSGMKVKRAKVRGHESAGMLCAEDELGISSDHGGLIELDDSLVIGQEISQALGLVDTMIEVDLTPNRPDCASVIGIAREVAGFAGATLTPSVARKDLPALTGTGSSFSIKVEDPENCPRYAARLLRNVTIGPSPWWLKNRLLAIGQRPINNIVDITNLVMMEYGQPLHAFDFSKLAQGTIVVRRPRAGESLTTLDGVQRELNPDMLLICDSEKPVAVAGVMGGENSEVSAETVDILLESAYFNPVSIRRTARNLKLATEASYRFERGVDPEGIPVALERAVRLMVEIAGAVVEPGGVDVCGTLPDKPLLTLRVRRANDLIGTSLTAEEMAAILTGIELGVEEIHPEYLKVRPPSFRVDIEREIDLVEEVARIVGYGDIPTSLPMIPMSFAEQDKGRNLRRKILGIMTSLGFSEVINYSFVSERHSDLLALDTDDPRRNGIRLLNPLTEDQSVMRTMLLPGVLENVRRNIHQQNTEIRLFEIGKVFFSRGQDEQPEERMHLAAVLSGRRHPGSSLLHFGQESVDLSDVRGAVETILQELGLLQSISIVAAGDDAPGYARKGTCSSIVNSSGSSLGVIGRLLPEVARSFGIKQDLLFMTLDLEELADCAGEPARFTPLPRYPSVTWDIAVLVPDTVAAGDMLKSIRESRESLVEHVELFDIYQGKSIEKGLKSVAFTITYRSVKQTLDDETVNRVHQKIIQKLISDFNGRLREAS